MQKSLNTLILLVFLLLPSTLLTMSTLAYFLNLIEADPCFGKYTKEAMVTCVENQDSKYLQTTLEMTRCHMNRLGQSLSCCTLPEDCVKKLEGNSWEVYTNYLFQLKKFCSKDDLIPEPPLILKQKNVEILICYTTLIFLFYTLRLWMRIISSTLLTGAIGNLIIELLLAANFPDAHFLLINLERIICAALVGKIAIFNLEKHLKQEFKAIKSTAVAESAELRENTLLLHRVVAYNERLERKTNKILATRYAENPHLNRDDLSENEALLLERIEARRDLNLDAISEEGEF